MVRFSVIAAMMLLCSCATSQPSDTLRVKLEAILKNKNADVGVAIIGPESGDTINIHGDKKYTIMSVVKFPQALAILHQVDEGKLALNQKVYFDSTHLNRKTYSPLRDENRKTPFEAGLLEILTFAAGQSDNIACDRLYDIGGGIKNVEQYIHSLGVTDFGIGTNYRDMKKETISLNWSTPKAMAQILELFYHKKAISDTGTQVLWNIMANTGTAPNRLKGLLPAGTVVAHKTGTYYEREDFIEAMNDVGVVVLPDGKHYSIAVFVNNSKESDTVSAAIIADINKAAWDYFTNRK